jgi:Tol biopolymer transport system component
MVSKRLRGLALALAAALLSGAASSAKAAKVDDTLREEVKGLPPIVLARLVDDNWDIWRVNPDGTGLTRLTTDPARDIYPKWSPDGKRIVFQSDRGAPPMPEKYPKWKWLRENVTASEFDKDYGVYIMDADGKNMKKIHQGGKTPAFSHDGKAIVFSFGGRLWVKVIDAKEEPWPITPGTWRFVCLPDWRPDGEQIVCMGKIIKGATPLLIDMDPATYKPVTREGRKHAWRMVYPEEGYKWHGCNPEYTADGKMFTHTFDGGGSVICTVGADGKNPPRKKLRPLKGWNHCGDWSPDGGHFAFAHADSGSHPAKSNTPLRLWIADVEMKRTFQVVKEDGMCRDPDWCHATTGRKETP